MISETTRMKNAYALLLILLISPTAFASGGQKHKFTFAEKDLFQTAYFLKNVPGLIPDYHDRSIRYFADHNGFYVFLTDDGLIYKLAARDEKKARERQRERKREAKGSQQEDEDEDRIIPMTCSYASMRWIGANPHPRIESLYKSNCYYTYLAGRSDTDLHSIVTDGYSQVIYHDLYPGIDVQYTLPDKGGMKYSFIIHPHADVSRVQMEYGADVRKVSQDKGGNIIIHTATGDFIDHAPQSFTETGSPIASSFQVKGNKVSFSLPTDRDQSQGLIIDPWVTQITQIGGRNIGADVDFDLAGNMYVSGFGISTYRDTTIHHKIIKFDQSGNAQWVFLGYVASIGWWSNYQQENYLSNIKVDKAKTKIYVGKGFESTGTQAIRLTSAGLYDNFITTANSSFRETWSIVSDCSTGKILALGGGTNSNLNMGVIDTLTGIVTNSNYTGQPGAGQDIVSGTYDAFGNLYVIMACYCNFSNNITKLNSTYNGYIWTTATPFSIYTESNNLSRYVPSLTNNFNSLAANGTYVYYYDGLNIAAYDLTTGAAVGTPTAVPGYLTLLQGGIAVDACDNVYVGGIGVIKTFAFNGSTFTPGADIPLGAAFSTDTILDVKYNSSNNLLYVTGTQIAATYVATPSITCNVSTSGAFTASLTSDCSGATVTVTPGAGLTNPVFSYLWLDSVGTILRQTVPDAHLVDSLTGLPQGKYTVQIQLNLNCGGTTIIDTFTITPCHNLTQSPDTTICAGQSVILSATGTPAGGAYLWMPGGAISSSITVSPAVSTPYYVTYTPAGGSPVTDTIHVYVTSAATVSVNDTAICSGHNAKLTATPSVTGGTYLWSPGGASTPSITVIPAGTAQYIVTYTTGTCGVATDTAHVSVSSSFTTPLSQTICGGSSFAFHGQSLSLPGTYRDTLSSVSGCDSILVLTLTVSPVITTSLSQTICGGSSISFGAQTISAAGTYRDTLISAGNCDSVVILTVNVVSVLTASLNQTICSGSSTTFAGQTISTAGVYRDTLPSVAGCDSIVVFTLSVLSPTYTALSKSICSGYSYSFNGQSISTGGVYIDTLTGAAGCDSIVTLTLTILPVSSSAISQTICSGSAILFHGQNISNSGVYMDTLTNVYGCDSTVTLTLTVALPGSSGIEQTICKGQSILFEGQSYTASGTYYDTLQTVEGCDSVVSLTLHVLPLPKSQFLIQPVGSNLELGTITVTDQSVNADSVLWLLNNQFIALSADHHLPITVPGDYCIRLIATSDAGCSDTSLQCINVYDNKFYMPNAFTPNGDGINDLIGIYGDKKSLKFLAITVFDRWGEKVFESNDLDFAWDGRYRGVLLDPGVYVYELELSFLTGSSSHTKGSITLIR